MTQFWPNFKGWFLGPSLTDSNCHGDIYSGNICSGKICPFQHNLSCYDLILIKLLELNFLGPFLDKTSIDQNNFWTKIFLGLIFLLFWLKNFLNQKFLFPKFFRATFFYPKHLGLKFFFDSKFFGSQIFVIDFLDLNSFFWTNHNWTYFFCRIINNINNYNRNHNLMDFDKIEINLVFF